MKKKTAIVVLAMVLAGLMAGNCFAAPAYYTCTVNGAGSFSGSGSVNLTDTAASPAFTKTWFNFAAASSNAQLAVALTALSNGTRVLAVIDTAVSGWQIPVFYTVSDSY